MKPDLNTYGGRLLEVGYAGQVARLGPTSIISLVSLLALSIDFGRAVARGASDASCKAPTADGDKIVGISARHATMVADALGVSVYGQNDAVPVMKSGWIYAVAAEAAVPGDAVLSLTAGNGTLGSTTGGAAGAGRVAVPGATWESTVAIGQVGLIHINS